MRPWSGLLLALVMLTGCSGGLILRDWDEPSEKAGKVAARALLCPLTLCFSELVIAGEKADEARQERMAQYRRWVHTLPPEEQAQQYQLEQERIRAAGQALLGLGMSGGLFRNTTPPAPLYQPQPIPVLPLAPLTTPRPPVNCITNQMGQYSFTNCQ